MVHVSLRTLDDQRDVSVPFGTTLSGLLSMLGVSIVGSEQQIVSSDGSPVHGADVIGHAIPSGSLLIVRDNTLSARGGGRASSRVVSEVPYALLTGAVVRILPVLSVVALVYVFPLWALAPGLSTTFRAVLAAVAVLSAFVFLARGFSYSAFSHLGLTLAVGACCLGFLPLSGSLSLLAPVVFCAAASLVSLLVWVGARNSGSAAITLLWLLSLVVSAFSSWFSLPLSSVAVFALLVSVWLGISAGSYSLRIPDSQLIDLPLVRTLAPSVRAPIAKSPAKITLPRVMRSVDDGRDCYVALVLWASVVGALAMVACSSVIDLVSLRGVASLVLVLGASVSFATVSRQHRIRLSALLMRIPPVVGLIAVSVVLSGQLPFFVLALVVLVFAAVLPLLQLLDSESTSSVWRSRLADIAQSIVLLALPIAAVFASGLFDYIRQVAS